jgi:superfamily II DNA or RNA helicase
VVSSLSARYKIGLTATPKRADGLEKSMFALLGGIIHEVPKEAVKATTCPIKVQQIETGYKPLMRNVLMGDGTIDYSKIVEDLIHSDDRYNIVFGEILSKCKGPTIILANRVEYLQRMCDDLTGCGKRAICLSTLGQSKKAKQMRKESMQKLNAGELNFVLATYALAKEGLDCPDLRYVVFATPEKDSTTVIQSAGRVGRKAPGKEYGTVIDFVDDFGMYRSWKKKRETIYKKIDAEIE